MRSSRSMISARSTVVSQAMLSSAMPGGGRSVVSSAAFWRGSSEWRLRGAGRGGGVSHGARRRKRMSAGGWAREVFYRGVERGVTEGTGLLIGRARCRAALGCVGGRVALGAVGEGWRRPKGWSWGHTSCGQTRTARRTRWRPLHPNQAPERPQRAPATKPKQFGILILIWAFQCNM